MVHTFNNLPDAQAFARANGVAKYWRVWFDDTDEVQRRARGGWWADTPRYVIYMEADALMRDLAGRLTSKDRTTIETLRAADVSDSPSAR